MRHASPVKRVLFLLVLFLSGCVYSTNLSPLAEKQDTAQPVLIKGVDVFTGDPESGILKAVDLLIENGRIARIGTVEPLKEMVVVDAAGKMVIPGLIDSHTHTCAPGAPHWFPVMPNDNLIERNLSAFLFAGVTTVFDMGGPLSDLEATKVRIASEKKVNPRFFYAGKMLTRKGGHPEWMIRELAPWPIDSLMIGQIACLIEDPEDIAPAIEENIAHGASLTKIMVDQVPLGVPSLYEPLIGEIVRASDAAGKMVASHIGSEADLLTAMHAGVRFFAHAPYRSSLSDSTVRAMKDSGAIVIPTLVVFDKGADFFTEQLEFSAFDRQIMDPRVLSEYTNPPEDALETDDSQMISWVHDMVIYREIKFENVRKMKAAGIPILAGSDSPNVAAVPGSSLHDEMRLLVDECGYTPEEALAAATSVSGDLIGRITGTEGLGRIKEGGPADLVILNGDFREDIGRTTDIHLVISDGRIVERKP